MPSPQSLLPNPSRLTTTFVARHLPYDTATWWPTGPTPPAPAPRHWSHSLLHMAADYTAPPRHERSALQDKQQTTSARRISFRILDHIAAEPLYSTIARSRARITTTIASGRPYRTCIGRGHGLCSAPRLRVLLCPQLTSLPACCRTSAAMHRHHTLHRERSSEADRAEASRVGPMME